jgi:hypothetical protein
MHRKSGIVVVVLVSCTVFVEYFSVCRTFGGFRLLSTPVPTGTMHAIVTELLVSDQTRSHAADSTAVMTVAITDASPRATVTFRLVS